MASNITLALNTARDGLLAFQSALGTVAENVTNANTPGYSRKIVNFETRIVDGVGGGVQIGEVSRTVDQGLLRDIREENALLNEVDVKQEFYARLEELFGSPADNTSLSHITADFVASLESLATSPNSTLSKQEVIRLGQDATDKLNDIASEIQDLRLQADVDLAETANRANQLINDFADTNDRIVRNSAVSNDIADLLDRRDTALDELSKLIDIQYFERSSGEVAVFTRSGTVLVDSEAQTISHNRAASAGPTISHAQGGFAPLSVNGRDITDSIRSGELKGLIDLRDGTLNDLQRELDQLAEQLQDSLNLVHNAGISFPGSQSYQGQTFFSDPANQTFQFAANNDTRLVLFDQDGNQQSTTTLSALFQDVSGSNDDGINYGPTGNNGTDIITIDEITTRIQEYLSSNGAPNANVSFSDGTSGRLNITLNNSSLYLGFRDEVADPSAGESVGDLGLSAQNATITFDATGSHNNGTYTQRTETATGFSNFFGLNDFFVDNQVRDTYETDIVSPATTTSATTLFFYDTNSGVGSGNDLNGGAGFTVQAGLTLDELAEQINNDTTLNGRIQATVEPEGSGQRLRLTHSQGLDLVVSEVSGGQLLNSLGFEESNIGLAQELRVNSDLLASPSRVSAQTIQFDREIGINGGEFFTAASDNSNATALSAVVTNSRSFEAAGSFIVGQRSILDYATSILSDAAQQSANNTSDLNIQSSLVSSLQNRSDSFRGVNLDEELSQLVLFEQSYAASARVITVISELFDTLEQILR